MRKKEKGKRNRKKTQENKKEQTKETEIGRNKGTYCLRSQATFFLIQPVFQLESMLVINWILRHLTKTGCERKSRSETFLSVSFVFSFFYFLFCLSFLSFCSSLLSVLCLFLLFFVFPFLFVYLLPKAGMFHADFSGPFRIFSSSDIFSCSLEKKRKLEKEKQRTE